MMYKKKFTWKSIIGLALSCIFFCSAISHAQTTFTQGASNGSVILWFKPDINIAWADIHFSAGGAQQNIRMTMNRATGRFEHIVNASPGIVVTYSFTYSINDTTVFDTEQFSATVPNSESATSTSVTSASSTPASSTMVSASSTSSSVPAIGITNGVADNESSVIIWLKPNNVIVNRADIHFILNNETQQNIRMTFNASLARYEQIITTTSGEALTITYSFTHETPFGGVDTATFNFTRTRSSSSVVSSGSSSSSSTSSSSLINSSVSSKSGSPSSIIISPPSSTISSSSTSSIIVVDVDKSLLIHDTETFQLEDFSFRSTLQQLVAQLNAVNPSNPTTAEELFAHMWDTQNPAPGLVVGGEKCTGVLNEFAVECRPAEGLQASNPVFFIGNYAPIALVNRFDLRDNVTFNDCGEYRVIYANQGGSRNFIIFEAQLPNPNPGVAAGCLPIAQFWQNLSAENNASIRATSLRNFYFNGIAADNVRPVIDIRNYANTTGQIRTNMFMGSSWNLKEFKVSVNAEGISVINPVSVKSNPVAFLFDGTNTDVRAPIFQSDFVANMDSLLTDFNIFSLTVANDAHNNGQSHASFPVNENQFTPAFFNANSNAFQQAVAEKLTTSGSNLTTTQLMNRATAMTCGGCHEPSNFGINLPNAIGPDQSWPNTLGFVHVSEFANAGVFPLSPALTDVFLPMRLAGFNNYLANTNAANQQAFFAPASQRFSVQARSIPERSSTTSSAPAQPVKKFNKRAG